MASDRENNFMKTFKYYKSNKPKPCLDQVITAYDNSWIQMCSENAYILEEDLRTNYLGLNKLSEWKTMSLQKHPGLLLIKNPFTCLGQRFWIRKCLEEYSRKPNKSNMDIERIIENWWLECNRKEEYDKKLMKKLRWITLGYHHNWDTKIYEEENRGIFPAELSELCDVIAQYLGYTSFKAEAAIVNYYHMGSTLSAHTDHSEINLEAPLFSFSFGQSAIFLIGGHDKSSEPSAILLSSGDIIVMSKEARLCYHAVPKILPASIQPWDDRDELKAISSNGAKFKYTTEEKLLQDMNKNIDQQEWIQFENYVDESRINVNVRQVLKENQMRLNDFIDIQDG